LPSPDPYIQAFNARWEEFEEQDYEGQIALFLKTLEEQEVMDDEMAFEMLNVIYCESVERDERERFEVLVDRLREQLPDVYDHDASYYLDWRIRNALATGRPEAVPAMMNEMAAMADKHIDTFNNVLDQLAYHGQLSALVEAVRIAWPRIKVSGDIVPWGIDEFAVRAADYNLFDYLERHSSPSANDPELIERLEFYFEVNPKGLARYIANLTAQVERHWTMGDFNFQRSRQRSYDLFHEDEDEPDEGRQNLNDLCMEFLGYLRREEGVPYTKGELGREQIQQYILERLAGELEPQENLFEAMMRPRGRKRRRKSRKPDHLLCPDRGTLDRFLSRLLHFINPQRYKAAATLELVPVWLRFLESRQLIDAQQRARTMLELRGLDTELLKVWKLFPFDPALQHGLQGWRDEKPTQTGTDG
jgi:hypothetical protein